jgi:hypothetical protein
MLAIIAAGLALASSPGNQRPVQVLNSHAACQLTKRTKIPSDRTYSISGVYFADGMHGSDIELKGCDLTLSPMVEDEAAGTINSYHEAFRDKCGGTLMGDRFTGVFTGHFVQKTARLFGMSHSMPINFFVVKAIETSELDKASIVCPK